MYLAATLRRRASRIRSLQRQRSKLLPRADAPSLIIYAGPNGSGKSSAYQDADVALAGRSVWIVNPDLLSQYISETEHLHLGLANREAVGRIQRWLEASIDVHKTVDVETVLSTGKYRDLVAKAKERGFNIWLIYVILNSPDLNVERVRLRVLKGGHAVPEEKIRSRYERSLQQLPWFLEAADRAWIYDNSGAEPKQIGEKLDGLIKLDDDAMPAVRTAVEAIRTA